MNQNLREKLKQIPTVRYLYFRLMYVKNSVKSFFVRAGVYFFRRDDYLLLRELSAETASFYPEHLQLTNPNQIDSGKNIIGYPAMGQIQLAGENIGWVTGAIKIAAVSLPFLQAKTDIEQNLPKVMQTYRPEIIVDFGTAAGGTSVFFYQLASAYCRPKILSIDISDERFRSAAAFHQAFGSREKISYLFKDSLGCRAEVREFLAKRIPGQKALLSFDDHHTYEHTYKELEIYAPLLLKDDVIVMQDSWDQGLFGHETSPMLAVHKFLKFHPDFKLDRELLTGMVLPCNFIHGVIIKQ